MARGSRGGRDWSSLSLCFGEYRDTSSLTKYASTTLIPLQQNSWLWRRPHTRTKRCGRFRLDTEAYHQVIMDASGIIGLIVANKLDKRSAPLTHKGMGRSFQAG